MSERNNDIKDDLDPLWKPEDFFKEINEIKQCLNEKFDDDFTRNIIAHVLINRNQKYMEQTLDFIYKHTNFIFDFQNMLVEINNLNFDKTCDRFDTLFDDNKTYAEDMEKINKNQFQLNDNIQSIYSGIIERLEIIEGNNKKRFAELSDAIEKLESDLFGATKIITILIRNLIHDKEELSQKELFFTQLGQLNTLKDFFDKFFTL